MDNNKTEYKINYNCEFDNKELEKEFFDWDIQKSMKYIEATIIFLGLLNFAFVIPDFLFMADRNAFEAVFIGRLLFLILFVVFYFILGKMKNYVMIAYIISFLEIIFALFFLFVLYKYNSPNFLIQALGLIVILLSLFILPNKWVNNFFVALFIGLGFLLFSYFFIKDLPQYVFMSGATYITIIIVLCAIFSFNTNYFKRINYVTNKRLEELVVLDHMTGLYNKRKFEEELVKCINFSKRYNTALSLAIFDFDDFKRINDVYGHIFGDTVIINAVMLIKKKIRNTDILSKWGGDEFTLLMPSTEIENAIILIERLRQTIENYSVGSMKISCSFGVTQLREDDDEITMFNRADKLLYNAKKEGKNNTKYE